MGWDYTSQVRCVHISTGNALVQLVVKTVPEPRNVIPLDFLWSSLQVLREKWLGVRYGDYQFFEQTEKVPLTLGSMPLSPPPLSSDLAAVFSHPDGWDMATGPDYSCAWPTKLFANIVDAGSLRLSWQPFLLQIHSLHSIPFDSDSIKGHWSRESQTPSAHDKGTSWSTWSPLLHRRWDKRKWILLMVIQKQPVCSAVCFPIDLQFPTIVSFSQSTDNT